MAVLTDTLMTVFQTTGADTLVKALKDIEAAMRKLNATQLKFQATLATGGTTALPTVTNALNVQTTVAATAGASMNAYSLAAVAGFTAVIGAAHKAIDSYLQFGKAVMDVRDLTGSSAGQSAQ